MRIKCTHYSYMHVESINRYCFVLLICKVRVHHARQHLTAIIRVSSIRFETEAMYALGFSCQSVIPVKQNSSNWHDRLFNYCRSAQNQESLNFRCAPRLGFEVIASLILLLIQHRNKYLGHIIIAWQMHNRGYVLYGSSKVPKFSRTDSNSNYICCPYSLWLMILVWLDWLEMVPRGASWRDAHMAQQLKINRSRFDWLMELMAKYARMSRKSHSNGSTAHILFIYQRIITNPNIFDVIWFFVVRFGVENGKIFENH